MLIYKQNIKYLNFITIKYGLTYFNNPYRKVKADVILEWQYPKKRLFSEEFHTLFIDLTEEEEAIYSEFEKNTKYEINRAITRDNIHIRTLNETEERDEFYNFYNAFANSKKRPSISEEEVDLLIENGLFKIRGAFINDETLVLHSYITANKRARLMQSASLFRNSSDNSFRNTVGRANRLLHWDDICYFKNNGYLIYDLGGIALDKNNKETQSINKFKECFGGKRVKEYKSQIPVTFKGFIFLSCKKLLGKL